MAEWWEDKGHEVYRVLGECVSNALDENESEIAVICGLPLAKLAEVEGANYFGYEGRYNYNTALDMARDVIRLAEEEGVPSFLRDDVEELKRILERVGWEV